MNAYDSDCPKCMPGGQGGEHAEDGCGEHGTLKDQALGYVSDAVVDFLYYDRKSDDDLPSGRIEKAVAAGILTIDELIGEFRKCLIEQCAEVDDDEEDG